MLLADFDDFFAGFADFLDLAIGLFGGSVEFALAAGGLSGRNFMGIGARRFARFCVASFGRFCC